MSTTTVTRTLVISNPTGLHARPCLAVVNTVRQHHSKVLMRRDERVVDASEMLDLMTLGAPQGTELVVTAEGPDAEQVVSALETLFADHFGLD
jgi:phosphotransferase system HPr (HPr) family protein